MYEMYCKCINLNFCMPGSGEMCDTIHFVLRP